MKRAWLVCFFVVAPMTWPAAVRAQDVCDALIVNALNEFETPRRVQLLVEALDPSTPCAAWPVAVQALAQTLIEDGRESLAGVWLRWAARRARDLQPDTLQFLPRVVQAYRAARTFVNGSRTAGDSLAATTWMWSAATTGDGAGRLQVSGAVTALRVEVTGVGLVGIGSSVALMPGSYELAVSAPGFESLRVTREVMPGVTTLIDFRPKAAAVQVVTTPPVGPAVPSRGQPTATVQPSKKKKFPVLLVVGGVVVVGGAVALLSPDPPPPSTGGITIRFP